MKYIDAEKLIAEIERRIDSWSIRGENSPVGQGKDTCVSRVTELSDLLSFITSLQQEQLEVDFEKEFDKYCEPIKPWQIQETPYTSMEDCAQHFYELGRKGGSK